MLDCLAHFKYLYALLYFIFGFVFFVEQNNADDRNFYHLSFITQIMGKYNIKR